MKKGRILPMQPLVPPGYQSLLSCAFPKPLLALHFLLLKFSYIILPDMGYNEKKIKKSHTHTHTEASERERAETLRSSRRDLNSYVLVSWDI